MICFGSASDKGVPTSDHNYSGIWITRSNCKSFCCDRLWNYEVTMTMIDWQSLAILNALEQFLLTVHSAESFLSDLPGKEMPTVPKLPGIFLQCMLRWSNIQKPWFPLHDGTCILTNGEKSNHAATTRVKKGSAPFRDSLWPQLQQLQHSRPMGVSNKFHWVQYAFALAFHSRNLCWQVTVFGVITPSRIMATCRKLSIHIYTNTKKKLETAGTLSKTERRWLTED